ncbi:MAG: hypothetical protein JKY51_09405 [Opitutaceae bacterium]|nr:hypothetical protein [Opitutaceae bacterium]
MKNIFKLQNTEDMHNIPLFWKNCFSHDRTKRYDWDTNSLTFSYTTYQIVRDVFILSMVISAYLFVQLFLEHTHNQEIQFSSFGRDSIYLYRDILVIPIILLVTFHYKRATPQIEPDPVMIAKLEQEKLINRAVKLLISVGLWCVIFPFVFDFFAGYYDFTKSILGMVVVLILLPIINSFCATLSMLGLLMRKSVTY